MKYCQISATEKFDCWNTQNSQAISATMTFLEIVSDRIKRNLVLLYFGNFVFTSQFSDDTMYFVEAFDLQMKFQKIYFSRLSFLHYSSTKCIFRTLLQIAAYTYKFSRRILTQQDSSLSDEFIFFGCLCKLSI